MNKFKAGDEVVPTARCREIWPRNNYGAGWGTVYEPNINLPLAGHQVWVSWAGQKIGYYYDQSLLEHRHNIEENE